MHNKILGVVFLFAGFVTSVPAATFLDSLNAGRELVLGKPVITHSQAPVEQVETDVEASGADLPQLAKKTFRVQCFASKSLEMLRIEKTKLQNRVDQPVYITFQDGFYKLQVGDFPTRQAAETLQLDLKQLGYPDAWVQQITR